MLKRCCRISPAWLHQCVGCLSPSTVKTNERKRKKCKSWMSFEKLYVLKDCTGHPVAAWCRLFLLIHSLVVKVFPSAFTHHFIPASLEPAGKYHIKSGRKIQPLALTHAAHPENTSSFVHVWKWHHCGGIKSCGWKSSLSPYSWV